MVEAEKILASVVVKREYGPIDKFKNENTIKKQFGEEGTKIYYEIDGKKTGKELLAISGLPEQKFTAIMNYMHALRVIELISAPNEAQVIPPSGPRPEPTLASIQQSLAQKTPAPKPPAPTALVSPLSAPAPKPVTFNPISIPSPSAAPVPKLPSIPFIQKSSVASKPVEKPGYSPSLPFLSQKKPEIKAGISPPLPSAPKPPAPVALPKNVENPLEVVAPPKRPAQVPIPTFPVTREPDLGPILTKQTPTPIAKPVPQIPSIAQTPIMQKPPPVPQPQTPTTESRPAMAQIPPLSLVPHPSNAQIEKRITELSSLESQMASVPTDPVDREIYDRYGHIGVRVHQMLIENKTPDEIMAETRLDFSSFISIMEFMESRGWIELEREEPKPKPAFIPSYNNEVLPIDRPIKRQLTTFQKVVLYPSLLIGFQANGLTIYNLIDNKINNVGLAKRTGKPFRLIDKVFETLIQNKAIFIQTLAKEEIESQYGKEAIDVFNRYGRDGVLLYELIDKKTSIKQIIQESGINPVKAIDIFVDIHKILGLALPINKQLLYRQLGIDNTPNKPVIATTPNYNKNPQNPPSQPPTPPM